MSARGYNGAWALQLLKAIRRNTQRHDKKVTPGAGVLNIGDSYWQLAVETQYYSVRTARRLRRALFRCARDLGGPGRRENRQQQRSVASMPAHHSNVTLATALLDDALSLTEIGCGV
jgi:hypothetical protein